MKYNIAVIPGDGIGPEIVTEAKKVLDKVASVDRNMVMSLHIRSC